MIHITFGLIVLISSIVSSVLLYISGTEIAAKSFVYMITVSYVFLLTLELAGITYNWIKDVLIQHKK